jgi:ATP-dependent helicase/DNAse subunit B
LELAEERLKAFARVQARERAAGWKIVLTEDEGEKKKPAEIDLKDSQGRSLTVYGRPDRMDRNEQTGRWRIVDIKTSSTPKPPERAHQQADGTWKDLQMPLYRELAPIVLGGEGKDWDAGRCDLVYFQLPKDVDKAGISKPMEESTVLEALEKAKEVASSILDGKWDEIGELDSEMTHPTFLALCGLAGIPQSVQDEESEE